MTREEALNLISVEFVDNYGDCSEYMHIEDVEKLIKNIYNDFEKEKRELKSDLEEFRNSKANTFSDYKFTNCNECINKVDNCFTEICFNCKRYYGCYFKKKTRIKNG